MPPRHSAAVSATCAHLRINRLPAGTRFASSTNISITNATKTKIETPIWRGIDPSTRMGDAVTGAMEWQTSTYSFNKQNTKTLPAAATSAQQLIEQYLTLKHIPDRSSKDPRVIRGLLNARRRSPMRAYVSSPRIKDYGTYIHMTCFVWDGSNDDTLQYEHRRNGGRLDPPGSEPTKTDVDYMLEPEHLKGLNSLISRIYAKPVQLRLVRLAMPHLDADILASLVTQRLKDRNNTPRKVIRDYTWKVPLPDAHTVSKLMQSKLERQTSSHKLSWQDMTYGNIEKSSAADVVEDLGLKQVTGVQVEAAGRLTKRLTANRSARKMARRGTTAKMPSPILLGLRKKHTQYSFRTGKRRVGQFGIRVHLNHT